MKSKSRILFLFASLIVLNTTIIVETKSQISTITISVDPPSVVMDETVSSFTININVSYIERLNNWRVKMRYNLVLLYTNSSLIQRGSLSDYPGSIFRSYFEADYLQIDWYIPIEDYDYGEGTLATITFRVKGKGETNLDLYDTRLGDELTPPTFFDHFSQDGYFRNVDTGRIPTASFSHSPAFPIWYENVTFDASASQDPDGTINRYLWFFGDINSTTGKEELGANETDPITYHTYAYTGANERNFTVRLIVIDNEGIDNEGITGKLSIDVLTVVSSLQDHDMAVVNVQVNSTRVDPGGNVTIIVWVENQGRSSETFNVTAYYDSVVIDTESNLHLNASYSMPVYFVWNTTGIAKGLYLINATVTQVLGETDTLDNTKTFPQKVAVTYAPVASFTYEPSGPFVDDAVAFDASASYDPDGSIKSFVWDFGDGNITATNKSLITHCYGAGRIYTVALTVIDDLGVAGTTEQSIDVLKLSSTISLNVSTTATVGLSSTISGAISPVPVRSGFNVTISYRLGEGPWTPLKNTTADINGFYTVDWTPNSTGAYQIKSTWLGDEKHYGDESDVMTVVVKFGSSIWLYLSSSSVTIGEDVEVHGWISPVRPGVSVTIIYREVQGSWITLGSTLTDQNGNFTYIWKPVSVGAYEIKASWDGDDVTHGNESEVKLVTVKQQEPFNFLLIFGVVALVAVGASLFWFFWKKHERK